MTEARDVILVVDDEPQIRRFLRAGLGLHGYEVVEAATGREGIRRVAADRPDLVVLDLGLPDLDGLEVLATIRGWSEVPVFVLSVQAREAEKVRALDAGADDYVTKPFGMPELLARIRGTLRRRLRALAPEPVFTVGDLEVDLEHRIVRRAGAEIRLSPKQYRLLHLLVTHAGKVVTHEHLLREVWGSAHTEDVHYLRIFVRKLRTRLEADPTRPRYIQTELGVGYRLRSSDQLDPA